MSVEEKSTLAMKAENVVGRMRASLQSPKKARAGGVFERMGWLLDQRVQSESDVVRIVTTGLPAKSLRHLSDYVRIELKWVGPESTIRRRLQGNSRFTTDESERMVRMARVSSLAVELFRDESAAKAWLETPAQYVSGQAALTPIELSVTDSGARIVEGMLLRTAHGVF